jgi:hypothetical protein
VSVTRSDDASQLSTPSPHLNRHDTVGTEFGCKAPQHRGRHTEACRSTSATCPGSRVEGATPGQQVVAVSDHTQTWTQEHHTQLTSRTARRKQRLIDRAHCCRSPTDVRRREVQATPTRHKRQCHL